MVKAQVKAGICNLGTVIEAQSPDGMTVTLAIESECPKVQAMAAELTVANAFQELFKPANQTGILELAAKQKLHTTCLVPVGVLKAIEVAANMALPADAHISLQNDG